MASGDHFHTPGDQPKAQGQGSVEIERSHCNFQMAQSSPEKLRDVCRAAGTGDIETVNAWLRTAPDVNAQDDKGRPLLLLLVCGTITARGSFSDQAGRVSSIWVSACVGLPGVGAGPGRGIWEGQVASVRPWAAFGRPRGLERGHSGGSMYKVGFGRGRLLPTSVVLIDLY